MHCNQPHLRGGAVDRADLLPDQGISSGEKEKNKVSFISDQAFPFSNSDRLSLLPKQRWPNALPRVPTLPLTPRKRHGVRTVLDLWK